MTPAIRKKQPMIDLLREEVSPISKEKSAEGRIRGGRIPRLALSSDGWIDFRLLKAISVGSPDEKKRKKGDGNEKISKVLSKADGKEAP